MLIFLPKMKLFQSFNLINFKAVVLFIRILFWAVMKGLSCWFTARKMSKYGVFSGPYFPVFGLNTGTYGPENTPFLDTLYLIVISSALDDPFLCWMWISKIFIGNFFFMWIPKIKNWIDFQCNSRIFTLQIIKCYLWNFVIFFRLIWRMSVLHSRASWPERSVYICHFNSTCPKNV